MLQSQPKALKIGKFLDKVTLIVHGQGVVIFDASEPGTLHFSDASGTSGLRVAFTETEINVNMEPSGEPLVDPRNSRGIVPKQGAYYWFSLDSQNQRLQAGVGEARMETLEYTFQATNKKAFFESLVSVKTTAFRITRLLRDPITRVVPLLVKNTEQLTMDTVETYMPKANLSLTSQKLYDCISGSNFRLDTPDFHDFMNAIEYSIATPGKWCYERLKQKATEFDKDKPNYQETYLRITLGENNGESPGVPYVMEIWPVGHFSPIHNHGDSSAIIRVLNGSINVSLFPFLSDDVVPFAKANFKKGDITWISPTLNQVHQLKNLEGNRETCVTIQCYMYEGENIVHYDYFDYIDGGSRKQQFEPDSDMDFAEFKKLMKKEWAERKCTWFCGSF